jgi:6-phosphogluconolactonase
MSTDSRRLQLSGRAHEVILALALLGLLVSCRGQAAGPVTSPGRFVYVPNYYSATISAFTVDSATGALSPVPRSPFPTRGAPYGLVATGSGRFLYTSASNNLLAFSIDSGNGSLSLVSESDFTGGSLAVDDSGRFLYAAGAQGIGGFSIDSLTGALAPLPAPTPLGGSELVAHPSRPFLYALRAYSFPGLAVTEIDSSGALRSIAGSPFESQSLGAYLGNNSFAIDASGRHGFMISGDRQVRRVGLDLTSGSVTVPPSPNSADAILSLQADAIAIDPSAEFLFVMSTRGRCCPAVLDVTPFAIDPETGSLRYLKDSVPGSTPLKEPAYRAMVVDPSGRFLYVTLDYSSFEVLHGNVLGPTGQLFVFLIDQNRRSLVQVPGSPFDLQKGPGTPVIAR